MRLPGIPLNMGVLIVAVIVLFMLTRNAAVPIVVGLIAFGIVFLIDRFTPRRIDRRVTMPTLAAVAVTALLDLSLFRGVRQTGSYAGPDVASVVLLTGVAAAGLSAVAPAGRGRRRRTGLLLGASAVEAAGVIGLGIAPITGLVGALLLAVAGVAAYDERPPKPRVVADVPPPSFWRHM